VKSWFEWGMGGGMTWMSAKLCQQQCVG